MSASEEGPLVVHPHLHPRRTGVTRHVETVVPFLARDFEVTTWGKSLDLSLPRSRLRDLWRRMSVGRGAPVIWHAHRNNELLLGLVLRLAHQSLKVVFTRHSSTRPGLWTRLLARRADRVLALNAPAAAHFGPQTQVLEHGVDLQRFAPPASDEARRDARTALGLDPLKPALGVVGRVRPEKGQGDLAAAWEQLPRELRDRWQVVMVGRIAPEHRAFAEGLSRQLGTALHFLPERPDVELAYRALDVVVQPSHTEGFSLVLLEAMASGCCVIASALPYAQVALEHGRTGFLYPPRDVTALSATLADVLAPDRPHRLRTVSTAAAGAVRERFGLEHEAAKLGALYRELCR